jgi:hypothetical protein
MNSMQTFLAADIAGVFASDMPGVCVVDGANYSVLCHDVENSEVDAYGGAEMLNPQEIHFLTAQLPAVENGIQVTLYPHGLKGVSLNLLTVSNVVSADGNELIVKARSA